MTGFEIAYLSLAIGALAGFSAMLAWVNARTAGPSNVVRTAAKTAARTTAQYAHAA